MSRLCRQQQRAAVARIEHQVIDDIAQEMRTFDPPLLARSIRPIDECALARSYQKHDRNGTAGASSCW
jgi:hypothetical protein